MYESSVFEKTYRNYLKQVATLNLKSMEHKLGITIVKDGGIISLFGTDYRISGQGITGMSGRQPSFEIRVVLCKYLLLCPEIPPREKDWINYREFKDSGPLTVFFANDVENKIAANFSGRPDNLEKACTALGGHRPEIELPYDLSMVFNPLPRVPVLLLFNDADDEFPAKCSVLFEQRAEKYLDAECLAIIGALLAGFLITS